MMRIGFILWSIFWERMKDKFFSKNIQTLYFFGSLLIWEYKRNHLGLFFSNIPSSSLDVIFYLMFDTLLIKEGVKHAFENNIQKA